MCQKETMRVKKEEEKWRVSEAKREKGNYLEKPRINL